jgi:hypothetical protein
MIRPFRTAIWALGSGSILVVAAALSRDESPRCLFLADRELAAARIDWNEPVETAGVKPAQVAEPSGPSIDQAPPQTSSQTPPQTVDAASSDRRVESSPPERAPVKPSVVFKNASLRSGRQQPSPRIEIGPLISKDSAAASDDKAVALVARLYRPSTLTVSDLERMIRPLLTPGVGTATASTTAAAGDGTSDGTVDSRWGPRPDVLLVRDRPEVVRQLDALYADLDAAPKRVVIDALIADVALPDSVPPGLELRQSHFGVIDAEPRAVVNSLRALGHVSIIATNQLQVVDRQWAELEWTQRLGESTAGGQPAAAAQELSLRLGTKFRIRPSVLADGLVRLEVHPQSSRLKPGSRSERPEMATVAFTTDIVLHAGATAVIAGLVDERPTDTESARLPGEIVAKPGDIPTIHPQPSVRRETVLLVMPRIAHEN